MLKKIGMMALGVFTIFCGLGLIEMGVLEPTYELASRIFASICGGIFRRWNQTTSCRKRSPRSPRRCRTTGTCQKKKAIFATISSAYCATRR